MKTVKIAWLALWRLRSTTPRSSQAQRLISFPVGSLKRARCGLLQNRGNGATVMALLLARAKLEKQDSQGQDLRQFPCRQLQFHRLAASRSSEVGHHCWQLRSQVEQRQSSSQKWAQHREQCSTLHRTQVQLLLRQGANMKAADSGMFIRHP